MSGWHRGLNQIRITATGGGTATMDGFSPQFPESSDLSLGMGSGGAPSSIINFNNLNIDHRRFIYTSVRGTGNYTNVNFSKDYEFNFTDLAGSPLNDVKVILESPSITFPATQTDGTISSIRWNNKENQNTNAQGTTTFDSILFAVMKSTGAQSDQFRYPRILSNSDITTAFPNATLISNNLDFLDQRNSIRFSAYIYGRQIVYQQLIPFEIGRQTISSALAPDLNLTATTYESVPTGASNYDDVYDMVYKYVIDNNITLPMTTTGGALDFGTRNIVFDNEATTPIVLTSDTITIAVPANMQVIDGSKFRVVRTTGSLTGDINGTFGDSVQEIIQ